MRLCLSAHPYTFVHAHLHIRNPYLHIRNTRTLLPSPTHLLKHTFRSTTHSHLHPSSPNQHTNSRTLSCFFNAHTTHSHLSVIVADRAGGGEEVLTMRIPRYGIPTRVRTRTHTNTRTRTHTCARTHAHAHSYAHMRARTHTSAHTLVHTHKCMHVPTHVDAPTRRHTHIQAPRPPDSHTYTPSYLPNLSEYLGTLLGKGVSVCTCVRGCMRM